MEQQPKAEVNPVRRQPLTEHQIQTLRAVYRGDATPHQQRESLSIVIVHLCQTYGMPWRKDPSMKDVAIGRMCVGQDIIHYCQVANVKTNTDKQSVRASFEAEDNEAQEQDDE